MITKYKININKLIINIDYLYEVNEKIDSFKKIIKYINLIIEKENIKFNGNEIIIYLNGICIGKIYSTNYYLKKLNLNTKNKLTEYNCYFIPNMVFDYNNKKIKTKKVLTF